MISTPIGGPRVWIPIALLLIAAFWSLLPVWGSGPDYSFGWLMPLLAAVLLAMRGRDLPEPTGGAAGPVLAAAALAIGLAAAVVARPLVEISPLWPAALWLHTGGLLLAAVALLAWTGGWRWARHFLPIFLVIASAVPWPAFIVGEATETLRPAIARLAAETLNLFHYRAVWHGTTITLDHSTIGVEEACSGLRSLQASVAMALFLGEYHRFRTGRRVALVAAGIAIALATNFFRTLFLCWRAVLDGGGAVDSWHDSAGYAAMTACLVALILLAENWRTHGRTPVRVVGPTKIVLRRSVSQAAGLAVVLLVLTEIGTRYWFWRGQLLRAQTPAWVVAFPREAPRYREIPLPSASLALLGCDVAHAAEWLESDGTPRAAYFIRWEHGQGGRWVPQMHAPEICLKLNGAELLQSWSLPPYPVGPNELFFQAHRFADGSRRFVVYYCLWERVQDREGGLGTGGMKNWWLMHWAALRAGRRGTEAQSLMVVMPDASNPEADAQMLGVLRLCVQPGK